MRGLEPMGVVTVAWIGAPFPPGRLPSDDDPEDAAGLILAVGGGNGVRYDDCDDPSRTASLDPPVWEVSNAPAEISCWRVAKTSETGRFLIAKDRTGVGARSD